MALFDQLLVVPRQVLSACESLSASDDIRDQVRGQRALNLLDHLRQSVPDRLLVVHTEIPQATSLNDVLIELARLEARLVTSDQDLATRPSRGHSDASHC